MDVEQKFVAEVFEKKKISCKRPFILQGDHQGWSRFEQFGIAKEEMQNRRLARQCLDWRERRPYLAGQLGASSLEKMFDKY